MLDTWLHCANVCYAFTLYNNVDIWKSIGGGSGEENDGIMLLWIDVFWSKSSPFREFGNDG